jgi:hypothetical protein
MPTGRFDASAAVIDDKLYIIGGFTMEFPIDRFTLNAIYKYKAVDEQYTPFGYGTGPLRLRLSRLKSVIILQATFLWISL